MPIVSWKEQMSLNYPPLDDEHKDFLEVINQAVVASKQADFKTMDVVFEKCYDYVRDHFSHEEDVMERISFPDIEAHMKAHQIFIRNISEFRQQYEVAPTSRQKQEVAEKTVAFLSVWFLGHVLSRDKLLKPYLVRLRNLPPRMNYS